MCTEGNQKRWSGWSAEAPRKDVLPSCGGGEGMAMAVRIPAGWMAESTGLSKWTVIKRGDRYDRWGLVTGGHGYYPKSNLAQGRSGRWS